MFLMNMFLGANNGIFSACIVPLEESLGLSNTQIGYVDSANHIGLLCASITFGFLYMNFPPMVLLTIALVLWTIITALTSVVQVTFITLITLTNLSTRLRCTGHNIYIYCFFHSRQT